MIRHIIYLCILVIGIGCSGGDEPDDNDIPDIPTDIERPEVPPKEIQMWVDAHANFTRLATKEMITFYLQRLKDTGFNEVYVDVKPGIGYALYDSDILPPLVQWGDERVERDWDYLGFWIEEAEKFDIKVSASISTTGFGYTKNQKGVVYDDNRWDGKTQMLWRNGVLTDMREIYDVDAAMLDLAFPEVQEFILSIVEEIVTKYPKLKGFCLDYCRYYNGEGYGMGDATISAFERYSGLSVPNRELILTSGGAPGAFFPQWIEFRSMTVTNMITNIRSKINSINPEMELHLWASASWGSRYSVGQNWASKNYVPSGWQYTANYSKTGFADQLDVFALGAYTEAVWISERPSNNEWTVENFVKSYNRYIMDECRVNGSIASYAYRENARAISDAVYLCLTETDGLSVFELSHVINFNQWNAIKDGIDRVMK